MMFIVAAPATSVPAKGPVVQISLFSAIGPFYPGGNFLIQVLCAQADPAHPLLDGIQIQFLC